MSYVLVYVPDDNLAPMATVHEALAAAGLSVKPYLTRNLAWEVDALARQIRGVGETLTNIKAALSETEGS